nr:M48 family metallopeptidase [Oscillospiraceae bacterium]
EETALREAAATYLSTRTEHFATIMNVCPTGIKITSAKRRWGSCSPKNAICYSWRLMLEPPEAIDYVVVHELAHIRHKDHGEGFHRFVASVLPDWKRREKLLR